MPKCASQARNHDEAGSKQSLDYSTLKKEVMFSSETVFAVQRSIRRYFPEYRPLRNQRCENPSSFRKLLTRIVLSLN
jgi:hypothetical protein